MTTWRAPLVILGVALAGAGAARAQAPALPAAASAVCDDARSLVAPPASFQGLRIDTVEVASEGLDGRLATLPLASRLHRATRESRIRDELLFAAGDAVDSLRVAESMRRLRSLGFLDDVELRASRCPGEPGVRLRVVTHDAWSVAPEVKLRSSSTTLGLRERNALGTGAAVRLGLRSGSGGTGLLAAARLPGFPVAPLATEVGALGLANGRTYYAMLATRRRSALDSWTIDARVSRSDVAPRTRPGSSFARTDLSLLLGRRLFDDSRPSAIYLLGGAEASRANLSALSSDVVLGPRDLRRSYAGLTGGLARVAARYDTLGWMLPRGGLVDVPRGVEGELLGGVGRDAVTGERAYHLDAWAGRAVSRASTGTLLVGDLWASGFLGDERLSASTVRGSLALQQRAPDGAWRARLAGERLVHPDPDVRALATLDPMAAAFPRSARLAEGALAASIERSAHLRALTHALDLDGALFAAGSYRWEVANAGARRDELAVAALGAGLRLSPSRSARSSVRLDVAFPVVRTPGVPDRPFVALTVVPWILQDRGRDGARQP